MKPQRGLDRIKPYVPGKPIEEVQREYGLQEVIKLASNENPLGPPPKTVAALQEALWRLNSYPDGQSHYLCRALAARLGVEPGQVTVGNGADGIILQACMAYLDDDSEVVASESSFPVYDIYAQAMRATMVKTPVKNYGLDLRAMAGAITPRTRLVFVCNPNNPTGTISTADEVEAFMAEVPADVLVVFDEAYYEFVDSPDYPETLRYVREGRKNVLILRTYSKVYGLAGIRLGYAVADAETLAPMLKIKEPFAVNLLAQVAGVAALQDDGYRAASVAANRAGRLFLYGEFDRLGLFYVKSHANFVLVRVGPQAAAVYQKLLERGVIVRPCGGYALPEFLRITVGDSAQNVRMVETLKTVMAELGILGAGLAGLSGT
ncbi:MAG: histidinol-phosphate transaminase [Vicinamibacterales bacterium]